VKILRRIRAAFKEMDLPETVHKYRNWNVEHERKVLTERQLYYALPSSFPDPMDCKHVVRYDLLRPRQKIQWIKSKLPKIQGESRIEYRVRVREVYQSGPLSNPNRLKELQGETFDKYDERMGVISLAEHATIIDMWNQYGGANTGFCIGYHPEILFEQLGGGMKVEYYDKPPVVYPEPIHSHEEQMVYQTYFKDEKYAYEDEYRTNTFRDDPMTSEQRIVIVEPDAFKTIILGPHTDEAIKAEFLSGIPAELCDVPVYEAIESASGIALEELAR